MFFLMVLSRSILNIYFSLLSIFIALFVQILRLGKRLQENYSLTELYLQNNKLVELNNALHHLTSLRILLLHCNQLTILTDVVYELRYMQDLKVLSMLPFDIVKNKSRGVVLWKRCSKKFPKIHRNTSVPESFNKACL